MDAQWVVVSLGGSLIVPDGVDTEFLRQLTALIHELVEDGYRFVLITGGGSTAREYQRAAAALCKVPADDLDWLGIHSTRLNAHLLRTIFRDDAYQRIITNPRDDPLPKAAQHKIIVGAGWRPGFSTDYDAAVIAERIGAKRFVNLSNVSQVFTEDPKKNPEAKPHERLNWSELRAIIGDDWSPGLHVPFDPVAAKLCQEQGLEVAILSAEDMKNVRKALCGEEFKGTIVTG